MSDELLDSLLDQERRLVFTSFDGNVALRLGVAMYDAARAEQLPVAISIRKGAQRLFHAALDGSSANNDLWLERKSAVVELFGHSSYYVGCLAKAGGADFNLAHRLDPARYSAHGGAFPIVVTGASVVGVVAVSGLAQEDDHRFVVEQLAAFLGTPD